MEVGRQSCAGRLAVPADSRALAVNQLGARTPLLSQVETMLSEGKTFLLRSAIFVGLTSVVTTIIYFTPVPGKYNFFNKRYHKQCANARKFLNQGF